MKILFCQTMSRGRLVFLLLRLLIYHPGRKKTEFRCYFFVKSNVTLKKRQISQSNVWICLSDVSVMDDLVFTPFGAQRGGFWPCSPQMTCVTFLHLNLFSFKGRV